MRPINLIPEEERRSHGTVTRTGPLAYILVGALGVLLVGVVLMVLSSNEISDRKGEVTTLEGERTAATAEVEELAPYVSFQQVAESRTETITSLADSRFDWVRVIRQLSLILPPRVYLTNLTGSAGGSEETGVVVPSLTIDGCAPTQNTVAAFVAALKEIDGVTRVGLASSIGGTAENESAENGTGCSAKGVFFFHITAVFDGAAGSVDSGGLEIETPEAETETSGETEGEPESSETESSEPESESSTEGTASTAEAEPAG